MAVGARLGVAVGGNVAVAGAVVAVGGTAVVGTAVGTAVVGTTTVGTSVGGNGVDGTAVGCTVTGANVGGTDVAGAVVGRGVKEGALVATAVGNAVTGSAVAGGFVVATAVTTGAGLEVGGSGVLLASGLRTITEAVAVGALRTGVAVGTCCCVGAAGADGGCATTGTVGTIVTLPPRVIVVIGTRVTGAGCLAPASALSGNGPPIPCAKSKAISGSVASASETMSCSSASDRLGMTGMELVASARATLRRLRKRRSGAMVAWRCATTTVI